ncbi:hypothetical protein EMIT0373P_30122 [Pseudomonas chlororaphis]
MTKRDRFFVQRPSGSVIGLFILDGHPHEQACCKWVYLAWHWFSRSRFNHNAELLIRLCMGDLTN